MNTKQVFIIILTFKKKTQKYLTKNLSISFHTNFFHLCVRVLEGGGTLTKQASHSPKWSKELTPQEKSHQYDGPLSLPSQKLRQLNHQLLYILQSYLYRQCNWTAKYLNIACKCFYLYYHQLHTYQNLRLVQTVKKNNCVFRCQIGEWCRGCIPEKNVLIKHHLAMPNNHWCNSNNANIISSNSKNMPI